MAAALVLATAACTTTSSTSEPTSGEPSAGGGGGSSFTQSVIIASRSFGPDITIPVGGEVTFVNNDGAGHTVTNGENGQAGADPLFDVDLAAGATSDPITFDTPGTYPVTCKIHSSMNMTITVE